MTSFTDLLAQGSAHAWLFIPSAILLGALHGLEPGHSKTMMAAFIIAIRGTVRQAILLGLCATLSHTLIVWLIALGGLYLWRGIGTETTEPYLQLISAVAIIGMAVWMIWRTRHDQKAAAAEHHHHHHDEPHRVETDQGVLALSIFEDGVPPRFQLRTVSGHGWTADDVTLETQRPDGSLQAFKLANMDGYLQSVENVPEPHDFIARLTHRDHARSHEVAFVEDDHHHHTHEEHGGLGVSASGYQDAHESAHASDIQRRFADRNVSTGQIVIFGLTGGLIPCPGAITILILCLQLKRLALGATLVASFSVGLAMTMVAAGVVAALSVKHVASRWSGFETLVRRAPYLSGGLILCVGAYVGFQGWIGISHTL